MTSWPEIQAGIFRGESGGDYGALFNFANRPGGPFSGIDLTTMTIDQAIDFAKPSGPYAQYVRGQVGRTATPMGAYQIVGDTLKQAKKWAGLTGDELMTPDIQDLLGQAVLKNQGTDAWAGYRGPATPGTGITATPFHVGGAGSQSGNFRMNQPDYAPSPGISAEAEPSSTPWIDKLKTMLGVKPKGTTDSKDTSNPLVDFAKAISGESDSSSKSNPLEGGPQPGAALAAAAQEDAARANASQAIMQAILAGKKPGVSLNSTPGGFPWPQQMF